MESPLHLSSIQERVLTQIKQQRVRMLPHAYFMARTVAAIVLSVLVLVCSVGVCNYLLFSIRVSHHMPLLSMGWYGIDMFVFFFPWKTLLADAVCVVILQRIVRTFKFGYRIPLLYILVATAVLVVVIAGLVDAARASDDILHRGYETHVPIVSDLYGDAHEPQNPEHGICPCTVLTVATDTLSLGEQRPDGSERTIIATVPPSFDTSNVHVGDHIFVVGTYDHGVLRVSDMHPWNPEQDGDTGVLPPPPTNGR